MNLSSLADEVQARALLFLTTLSNALLEALSSVQEAVADLHPEALMCREPKGSPKAQFLPSEVVSVGKPRGTVDW